MKDIGDATGDMTGGAFINGDDAEDIFMTERAESASTVSVSVEFDGFGIGIEIFEMDLVESTTVPITAADIGYDTREAVRGENGDEIDIARSGTRDSFFLAAAFAITATSALEGFIAPEISREFLCEMRHGGCV